jgi:GMP synthase-like glutamine amidotransferase
MERQLDIGVVNMYRTLTESNYVTNALRSMGYRPHSINGFTASREEILLHITQSPIRNWICSGSATTVNETNSPQIPLELLNLKEKRFIMICYSMESILFQLGVKINKRNVCKKELFRLTMPNDYALKNPMVVRRNHCWYFSARSVPGLIAQYDGEAMLAVYKNALLVQFHPEKTPDGKKLIELWFGYISI